LHQKALLPFQTVQDGLKRLPLRDPQVAGLACSTAACSAAGGAACPAATGAALVAAMQSGVAIPTLPANGSATFNLTYTVN
jgi:hypothetical protein